jgi:superfamily II DNA/RNA helicase
MSSTSDSDESDEDEPEYTFSTPEGHSLACWVLRLQLPYDPHDAQLEGICKAIDGIDIMVLTPTGSGKTGYFTMYMLLLRSLAANLELVKPRKKIVCQNLVMVIVFPTNGVEEEMVCRKSNLYVHNLRVN